MAIRPRQNGRDHGWTPECQALIAQIRNELAERDDILQEIAGDAERMRSFRLDLIELGRAAGAAADERKCISLMDALRASTDERRAV